MEKRPSNGDRTQLYKSIESQFWIITELPLYSHTLLIHYYQAGLRRRRQVTFTSCLVGKHVCLSVRPSQQPRLIVDDPLKSPSPSSSSSRHSTRIEF